MPAKPMLSFILLVATLFLPFSSWAADSSASDSPSPDGAEQGSPSKPRAIFHAIQPKFVVNVQDDKRVRFMQVEVEVMARDQAVIDSVQALMPMIKDTLIVLFTSKTYEQLKGYDGREAVRKEALAAVQKVLKDEKGAPGIENLLFTSIVTQ